MLTPQQALKQYFGFDQFREGQQETIQRVLDGQHTLLVMPTGSGKSLTYQLPALLKPGLTLVISPLIALMKDQVDSLTEAGLPATFINSSLPTTELNQRIRAVREGHVKLLYIAPERLRNRQFTHALANVKVSLLAVDEAHCISQWGHDFRPDYLHIGPTWQAMGRPTLLATTATATVKVQQHIAELLEAENLYTLVTGFNRPNLSFSVAHAPEAQTKLALLQSHLSQLSGSAIIYCATRRNTDEVANFVRYRLKLPADAYHAGLDRDTRHRVQTEFMAGKLKIVVATNAFGMGVDKPDVRLVFHYNMPATIEAYYQEAGRAGRDGDPATCVLCFAPEDQSLQHWLVTSDTPTHDDLHQVYARLSQAATQDEVYFSGQELSQITGLHPTKIRVTLSELEQAGVILHLGSEGGYDHWKMLPFNADALRQRARDVEQRAALRLSLLDKMLDYVHLFTCRRQFLLKYFGDSSPPKAPRCCDNHTTQTVEELPKAVTPQQWLPLVVLETARTLPRPVGRNLLAGILKGSRKQNTRFYTEHKFFGKLMLLNQSQILGLIDALIAAHYLRLGGADRPVITLTQPGNDALTARVAIPINTPPLPDPPKGAVPGSFTQRPPAAPDTTRVTFELFEQGLTPAKIAAERNLAESTIYNHLAKLIGEGKIALNRVVDPPVEAKVLQAVKEVGSTVPLWPLKNALPPDVTYEQIRCVLAAHPNLPRQEVSYSVDRQPESPVFQPDLPSTSAPDEIVLNAVTKLGGTLGRSGLAKLLTGSKAGWVDTFAGHSAYGQLTYLSQKAVTDIIDALITDGKLTTTGGNRPKVILPEQKLPAVPSPPAESLAPGEAPLLEPSNVPALDIRRPDQAVLALVTDLDGLLSLEGLAQLLTAGPDEVVSFSDHPLFGAFYGQLSTDEILAQIKGAVDRGDLAIGAYGRLILPDD